MIDAATHETDRNHYDARMAWRAILSAFCACLIGIGLARFAYTPLLPAIVDNNWFEAPAAAYLGAANLSGYLVGALLGRTIAARASTVLTLRIMMLAATAAFFACAFPVSFPWFFAWRFAAGLAGGALMVLAAPTVLPLIVPSRRGLASGVIFMGIGAGVALSGTLVPLLLQQGLRETWLGIGALSLLLTIIAWAGWPREIAGHTTASHHATHVPKRWTLRALYIEYALNAAGWVPHMIFLVDFVARGLGEGLQVGAEYWVLFGLGATIGPILAGHLADRTGFAAALRFAFLLEAFAVVIPALGLGQAWLIASSLIVGAFVTGTVPLMLGRIAELLPHHPAQQKVAWSLATVFFALFQAAAAYGLSFVFAQTGGNYYLLFFIGTGAMVLALTIDLAVAVLVRVPQGSARDHDA
ncbi:MULTISPECIES: YbfB/YjiJ family MFS transporter [Rhizobium]|uniref:MFS transporter n=1 Tax=Rhizobium tropici TaxID=398 RepID=A0A329YBG8_RHITR|nr:MULTISPECIES: YbfB/YjiJ family MFS transporter [Rhizobium]MBB3285416.1 putative MFS family arabinose efflux permease [Rhizobium sp. BK252]MBB3400155.1 putative MFS family arabinose efflux permease [Rhizobium sp. BK289]MBB3412735.1 putative MFS family arabinose efflux permease [Rhizobium sp. BK284]MBB3480621.1 putative MFS family arabinose efflux permease [Rhizobium sp. BK347]MDK4719282.1 YbfB/YjiJ family MFS transporter [Rhizobium sp. CNPSo 3968]